VAGSSGRGQAGAGWLAILAGNELLGIPGALLAVPVVASLSVILAEIQRERLARRSAGTG
jgi:predicted PurR-regulated permease PerM